MSIASFKRHRLSLSLLVLLLGLFVWPLLWASKSDAFGGSDDQARESIHHLAPTYQPWVSPLWTPPSSEVECLLFGLQSALGAGLLAYVIGYYTGLKKGRSLHVSQKN